jgi:hypothetical protein
MSLMYKNAAEDEYKLSSPPMLFHVIRDRITQWKV